MPITHKYLFFLVALLVGMVSPECAAQHKFEVGLRIDPVVIPVNLGTYHEYGLGYYDIRAKDNITEAAYADFTYWAFPHFGVSLGMGLHRYQSQISYTIPDIPNNDGVLPLHRVFQYSADGAGPVLSVRYRGERFRAGMGLSLVRLKNQVYSSLLDQ